MSTAEWMQNHRKKIPVMVNGKTFTITGNELFKVNKILFRMNKAEIESLFKVNNTLFIVNTETCENGSKTQISAENSAISTLKGGRGGFLINSSTSNPNSTVTSTINIKEKNIKKRKDFCENHSEEILKNFEAFWQAYPRCKRKTDKKGALKKFTQAFKADKSLTFEKVMRGLEFWKNDNSWLKFPVEDFIPAPEVWLNKCRWEASQNVPQPSEPARTIYAVPPAEEKRETISREEFVAILRGRNNGSRTAIQ